MMTIVGGANEAHLFIDGRPYTALIDTGSMVSTICENAVQELHLDVKPLANLIQLEGAGGHRLKYVGFVTVKIVIPRFLTKEATSTASEEKAPCDLEIDALLLVVPTVPYHNRVPVLVGTNVLEAVFGAIKADSMHKEVPDPWKLAMHSLAHFCKVRDTTGSLGTVITAAPVEIPPHSRMLVQGSTTAGASLCQALNVCLEATAPNQFPEGISVSPSYRTLRAATCVQQVSVEVQNSSLQGVTLPAGTTVCNVYQGQLVDPKALSVEGNVPNSSEMEALYQDCSQHLNDSQAKEVKDLLSKWKVVFAQHDLDLGKTSLVKHQIKLTDPIPFKEKYRRIPPAMVEEVRQHLKEMLDLGVIRESESPYCSNVVLVRKKDNSLHFCIDLRRLNNITVKDAYAFPRIEETFDSLQGATWFSTLDLKSSYWQVEIQEEDKAKTAFVVGQLGFYECSRMDLQHFNDS